MGLMGFLGACSKQRFRYSIVSFVAMIGLAFKMKPTSRLKWRTEKSRDEKGRLGLRPSVWIGRHQSFSTAVRSTPKSSTRLGLPPCFW